LNIFEGVKTVIVKKQYLPPISDWEGSAEFPRKEPVQFHIKCKKFDPLLGKCTRRDVEVEPNEIACKFFELKFKKPVVPQLS
jgi:hypothetical protein